VRAAPIVISIALMTDTARTSETPVNGCQTKRRNNPTDGHVHTRCRQNLKSRLPVSFFVGSNIPVTILFSNTRNK
jgi:hypothetical protein